MQTLWKSICLKQRNYPLIHETLASDFTLIVVVVVRIFNATRHPRHIEAAAIAMIYMYLYSLAFMDHPCKLGAAVCHQAPPCPLILNPGHVEYELGALMV